jgi:pyroglutamyl-peptidase
MSRQSLPTVLLTGFDPFGGESINPSWLAAERLHGAVIAGHRVVGAQLPTSFARAPRILRAAIRKHAPALILCIGQAGGRAQISLERIAINIDDARIADNDGAQPIDIPIVRSGPAACFTTLPIKSMLAALQTANIPIEVSQTAGTFVCNHVFYALMRTLAAKPAHSRPRGGFVHIPYLPDQTIERSGTPDMPLDTVIDALRIMIDVALRNREGRRIAAGATH